MGEDTFHVVEQIEAAPNNREIAKLLLRISDMVLATKHVEIAAAVRRRKFTAGVQFIDLRLSTLCSQRDRFGLLPVETAETIADWTMAMAAQAWSLPR